MLSDQDYKIAASLIGCSVAAIKTVDQVESTGNGFLPDGKLKILFEPHRMWANMMAVKKNPVAFMSKPENKKYSGVLYQHQGTLPYGKESDQWGRLLLATEIDKECAYRSASWGRYQCMGEYCKECGFDNVFAMVDQYAKGEVEHLMGFVRMIKARHLQAALQKPDWPYFKIHYNGGGVDDYLDKLNAAWKVFSS